jgi:hypothetical protein
MLDFCGKHNITVAGSTAVSRSIFQQLEHSTSSHFAYLENQPIFSARKLWQTVSGPKIASIRGGKRI